MKILLTGASGMLGHNLVERLSSDASLHLLTPSITELDLLNKDVVDHYLQQEKPDLIIHAAAKVGGIQANLNEPVEFLVQNTLINTHVIYGALEAGVPKLLNLGSSCMYPRNRSILQETDILTGELEPTNEGYALAKINATRLCQYICRQYGLQYKTMIPCNLYGPYDNFDPVRSHLLPAVIRKLHEAKLRGEKKILIWGDGKARREFMFVKDLVDFIAMAINRIDEMPELINVGLGFDYSINEYYQIAANVIGYGGDFDHDLSKPVGMQQKLMNVDRVNNFGWKAKTSIQQGIEATYQYFLSLSK